MKYLLTTLWAILLLQTTAFAQGTSFVGTRLKFGEVTLEEVQTKLYSRDSTAEAVYFYDYGETNFEMRSNDIYLRTLYHVRIKIFKKSAFNRGNVEIEYSRDRTTAPESVISIKGFTYNEQDGKLIKEKLTKEMIFDEQVSGNWYKAKFVMPNIKEGSVIEYSYVVETPFSVNHNPRTWYFQTDIPSAWSEYRIIIPNFFIYQTLTSGYNRYALNSQQQINLIIGNVSTYATQIQMVMKYLPAFRSEPFITTSKDHVSKIDFELASVDIPNYISKNYSLDYPALNKTLLDDEEFGQQYQRTGFLSDVAKELKKLNKDTLSQVQAAYDFIRKNMKWNEQESFWSSSIKKAFEAKTGSAGDLNLLLVALLREMNLEANPVILSTRSHGRIDTKYALMKRFNYVVASMVIAGNEVLLDATDETIKLGSLPLRALNHNGYVVKAIDSHFVSLEPTEKHITFDKADFKITETGDIKGTLSRAYGGYNEWSIRKKWKQEGKDTFIESIKKSKPSWNIIKAELPNPNDPPQATYELVMSDYITKVGDLLYLKPMLSEARVENPLKAAERMFPVDFGYLIQETCTITYELPAGYSFVEIPKPLSINLPDNGGKFLYSVDYQGNKITITSLIIFRKSVYYAEEYPYLRELYDKVIAKHSEPVVLKKN